MKKRFYVFNFAFVVLLIFSCSDLNNPFLNKDESLAKIVNLADSASVNIFSTKKIAVDVYLKEHLDSIKLHIDNNRLWRKSDTVIVSSNINPEHNFSFSFYDTGWQTIRLVSYRNNGDSIEETRAFYAVSPLMQSTVKGAVGDSIVLRTNPVSDQVVYVWNFRNGVVIKEPASSVKIKVTTPFTSSIGELYVEDLDQHRSPVTVFSIAPPEQTKLKVDCIADSIRGDSVYSTTSNFKFTIEVTGAQQLKSARVNGKPFDDSLRIGDVFVLKHNISRLDSLPLPVEMQVSISDNLNRSVNKKYYVFYAESKPGIYVAFPEDSMETGDSSVNVQGLVTNLKQSSTMYLFIRNNGRVLTKTTVTPNEPVFSFETPLSQHSNHISLELYPDAQMQGSQQALTHFYVFYNPDYKDTLSPQIRQIFCNKVPVDSAFTSRTQKMLLEIDAVDNSGKQTVFIDGVTVEKEANALYYAKEIELEHTKESRLIHIKVIDGSGYSTEETIYVRYNQLPEWIKIPSYTVIDAEKEYNFEVDVSDPDNDQLAVNLRIPLASGAIILSAKDGVISWKPQLADTGSYVAELTAWDQYEEIKTVFNLVVKNNDRYPVKLLINKENIPDTLFMGDTLNEILHVVPLTGTRPFYYSAYFVDSKKGSILDGPDSALTWIPGIQDVGLRHLRLKVVDSVGFKDSVELEINVAIASVKLRSSSYQFYEGRVDNDLPQIIIDRKLTFPVDIGYSLELLDGQAQQIDFSSSLSGTVRINAGDTTAQIPIAIVDDTIPETTEKFKIKLAASDSFFIPEAVFDCEIIDDDRITFGFVTTEASGIEANRPVTATVSLSKPLTRPLTVYYELDTENSTATLNQDFLFTGLSRSINFKPGEISKNITINILNDRLIEYDETILIKLYSTDENAHAENAVFKYIIINDDEPVKYSFEKSIAKGSEGDTIVEVKVTLSRKIDTTVTLHLSVDDDTSKTNAELGSDFRFENGTTITFKPNDTVENVRIIIFDDTIPEENEFFTLKLHPELDWVIPDKDSTFNYTILTNEVTVFFAAQSDMGIEKHYPKPYCKVMLSSPLKDTLNVSFSIVNDSTTASLFFDYMLNPFLYVTFLPGETQKDIEINIVDDMIHEDIEYIYLEITKLSDYRRAYIDETRFYTKIGIQSDE